jgi:hypothetical protein
LTPSIRRLCPPALRTMQGRSARARGDYARKCEARWGCTCQRKWRCCHLTVCPSTRAPRRSSADGTSRVYFRGIHLSSDEMQYKRDREGKDQGGETFVSLERYTAEFMGA